MYALKAGEVSGISIGVSSKKTNAMIDSLPAVFTKNHSDLIESKLRNEAVPNFARHQLPKKKEEWDTKMPSLTMVFHSVKEW